MVNWPKHLQSERQHLYHIYWSLWRQFSWKKSLLVICSILGLFVNPWRPITSIVFLIETIYCKIFRCNYLRKKKIFSKFFLDYGNLDSICNIFRKKDKPHAFLNLPTPLLDKCLKSLVSEDPLTSKMVKGQKHCWDLNDSTFPRFIDHCERYSVGKCLS